MIVKTPPDPQVYVIFPFIAKLIGETISLKEKPIHLKNVYEN
jgi:hypothetical protein